MQQAQQRFEHVQQGVAGAGRRLGVLALQRRLGQFHEPVAEPVPGELVQHLRQQVEAVGGEVFLGLGGDRGQTRQDPLLRIGARLRHAGEAAAFGVHQREAAGVPQLVAEVLVAFGAAEVELDVAAVAGQGGDGEAQGVGAVGDDAVGEFLAGGLLDLLGQPGLHQPAGALGDQIFQGDAVDDVQRVEHIALGLGHLLALGVADQAGDVDVAERHLAGEPVGGHDHPRHPEEDDVEAGDQHRGRQVAFEAAFVHRLRVGPAQGRERPQLRGEPGLQHVAVLGEHGIGGQAKPGAHLRLAAADMAVAFGVEPGRDAMAPPQLAADAPVLDVLHPVAVGVDPVRRDELHFPALHQLQPAPGQPVHLHEPLVGQVGLDHLAGAVAARDLQRVRPGLHQQAEFFQVGQHRLSRLVAVQSAVLLRRVVVECGHRGEQVDQRQVVAHADLVVVEVVRRGHLDHAGTEGAVDVVVGDHRDAAAGQRQQHVLSDQRRIARVLRMDHRGGVAQHRLRTGGGHDQVVAGFAQQFVAVGIQFDVLVGHAVGQWIADRPQEAVLLHVLHFQVGDRGLQHRIPVDQALAAVDQAVLMPAHERLDHRRRRLRVHGEGAARPVAGGAQPAHLPLDGVARLRLPVPDPGDEALAAQRIAALALAFQGQVAADHHLGGDAGVVGAHLPQHVEAAHAVVAHQRVHQRVLEGVAHVQGAGHVRRRQQDRIGHALATRLEAAAGFPLRVQARFEGLGFVAGGQGVGHGFPGFGRGRGAARDHMSCLLRA